MQEEIIQHINDPKQLEKLYRENKTIFKNAFNTAYPEIKENAIAQAWNERLNFETEEISWGSNNELRFVIVASVIAGIISKIPELFDVSTDFFYSRNIGFIIFPILTVYFTWKLVPETKILVIAFSVILLSIVYINILPNDTESDTLILSCIHLPLVLWSVLGFIFVGNNFRNNQRRLDFLRYNGDLIVMTTIIVIAGILLSAISMVLFEIIDIPVDEFYFQYVAIIGMAASPIVATYLVQTNPQLVNKVSPIIAKVFTPLVLFTLIIYLIAVIGSGKDPYNDREFLLVFNILLIGVMAIILFAISERSKNNTGKIGTLMLLELSIVTIIINGIALSAIIFRISEWGFTPNRLAVLGGNILILTNLILVTINLIKTIKDNNAIQKVENSITSFLPVYSVWSVIVTFVFPLIFNFR